MNNTEKKKMRSNPKADPVEQLEVTVKVLNPESEANRAEQVLAVSFEGICGVFDREQTEITLRGQLAKGFTRFRQAIPDSRVKILLYTRIPEKVFFKTIWPVFEHVVLKEDA